MMSGTRSVSAIVSGPARTGRMGSRLEAAPASGRRPQRSRDDRPGRHQADPDHDQQRPGRNGRRRPTAAEWVPRSGAGDGEQPNDCDGRNDGARWWAAKLDEASDRRL